MCVVVVGSAAGAEVGRGRWSVGMEAKGQVTESVTVGLRDGNSGHRFGSKWLYLQSHGMGLMFLL